jgi:hypothetical protein
MARQKVGDKKIERFRRLTGLPVVHAWVRGGTNHRVDLGLIDGVIVSYWDRMDGVIYYGSQWQPGPRRLPLPRGKKLSFSEVLAWYPEAAGGTAPQDPSPAPQPAPARKRARRLVARLSLWPRLYRPYFALYWAAGPVLFYLSIRALRVRLTVVGYIPRILQRIRKAQPPKVYTAIAARWK